MMSGHTACNCAMHTPLPWPQFKNVKEFYNVRFDMDVHVTVSYIKKQSMHRRLTSPAWRVCMSGHGDEVVDCLKSTSLLLSSYFHSFIA